MRDMENQDNYILEYMINQVVFLYNERKGGKL